MSASGWKKLPRDNDYVLKQGLVSVINFASLRMDITRYKSCLKLSIYENGLEIKPLPIILWFHKPLFLEWNQFIYDPNIKDRRYCFTLKYNKTKIVFWGRAASEIERFYLEKCNNVN
jgi:hypothetical protein